MKIGGAKENMNARMRRVPHRLVARIDVAHVRASETTDGDARCRPNLARDVCNRFELAWRRRGEPRLDDVHSKEGELLRHLQLLPQMHGAAGSLLAIPQCRVEDSNSILHGQAPP